MSQDAIITRVPSFHADYADHAERIMRFRLSRFLVEDELEIRRIFNSSKKSVISVEST